ncbi:hypothetical protein [Salmonella phage SD-1_S14]|nr:hypothetical protein [Salmonella phage SD-6_S16]WPK20081.1 hypothetical protein [Salmonella phage SD-1_S14]
MTYCTTFSYSTKVWEGNTESIFKCLVYSY